MKFPQKICQQEVQDKISTKSFHKKYPQKVFTKSVDKNGLYLSLGSKSAYNMRKKSNYFQNNQILKSISITIVNLTGTNLEYRRPLNVFTVACWGKFLRLRKQSNPRGLQHVSSGRLRIDKDMTEMQSLQWKNLNIKNTLRNMFKMQHSITWKSFKKHTKK